MPRMKVINLKTADIREIRKKLEKSLDSKRYEHTLGVAYTASALAMCNQENTDNALVAGLLHDCAKCLSNKKRISICEKNHIPITEIERKNPFLLHAKVGCYLAEKQFHIHDKDILNAILYHTTGRPQMSQLEKIIYIADYIEPGRKHAANLPEVRKMAFQDLDRALMQILGDILGHLESGDTPIDPMTQKTYDYYINAQKAAQK